MEIKVCKTRNNKAITSTSAITIKVYSKNFASAFRLDSLSCLSISILSQQASICSFESFQLNRELQEYDPDDPFEKWAAEETDYSDKY